MVNRVRASANILSADHSVAARRNSRRLRGTSGFTLVELIIVMAVIGVLILVAIPNYVASIKNAREAVLKEDLHVLRQAIDSYTMDKAKAPQSLDDLIQAGYLKSIPADPVTHSNTTWVTVTDDTLQSTDQTEPGVSDVHSGSDEQGSDGQPYSSW
jgi:general secretion pathway protein G